MHWKWSGKYSESSWNICWSVQRWVDYIMGIYPPLSIIILLLLHRILGYINQLYPFSLIHSLPCDEQSTRFSIDRVVWMGRSALFIDWGSIGFEEWRAIDIEFYHSIEWRIWYRKYNFIIHCIHSTSPSLVYPTLTWVSPSPHTAFIITGTSDVYNHSNIHIRAFIHLASISYSHHIQWTSYILHESPLDS